MRRSVGAGASSKSTSPRTRKGISKPGAFAEINASGDFFSSDDESGSEGDAALGSTTLTSPQRKGLFRRRYRPRSDTKDSNSGDGDGFDDFPTAEAAVSSVRVKRGIFGKKHSASPRTPQKYGPSHSPPEREPHHDGASGVINDSANGNAVEVSPPAPISRPLSDPIGLHVTRGASSMSSPLKPSLSVAVRYGDTIRFWALSPFENKWSYMCYMRRLLRKGTVGGKTELFFVPPEPKWASTIFQEASFKIVDPLMEKEDGEVLKYGDEVSFVDDHGMVWNNKDGRLHGRLGPTLFGNGGHMHMTFGATVDTWAQEIDGDVASPLGLQKTTRNAGKDGLPVVYGDACVIYAKKLRSKKEGVIRAAVTCHRKRSQRSFGGFIRSDGKGSTLMVCIHHAPPRISTIAVYRQALGTGAGTVDTHTHHNVPWGTELDFDLQRACDMKARQGGKARDDGEAMLDEVVIRVGLSNGGEVVLRKEDIDSGLGKGRWFAVQDVDSEMCLKASVRTKDPRSDPLSTKSTSCQILSVATLLVLGALMKAALIRLLLGMGLPHHLESLGGAAMAFLLEIFMGSTLLVCASKSTDVLQLLSPSPAHQRTCYAIKLLKCEFGRPEDKGKDEEDDALPPMPQTFLLAELGDNVKAMERWKMTVAWRRSMGSDAALGTPHPKWAICKQFYPCCFHGHDKEGGVVYYERLGGIDVESLRACGVDPTQLMWHYMWNMEYLWTKVAPSIDDRCTIVLDMKGVKMGDIKGEVLAFIRNAISMLATHYPSRSNCIFIINVPRWFDLVFRLIRPLLNEGTKRKLRPCDASRMERALKDWIDEDELPREYGGRSAHALFDSPWERNAKEHVEQVLRQNGQRLELVPAHYLGSVMENDKPTGIGKARSMDAPDWDE
jgi:hypothetical protein